MLTLKYEDDPSPLLDEWQSFSSLTGLIELLYLIDWKAWGAKVSNRTRRIADSPRNLILAESTQLKGENEIEVNDVFWA